MLNLDEIKDPEEHPLFSEDFEILDSSSPKEKRMGKKEMSKSNIKDDTETLENRFSRERSEWKDRVVKMSKGIQNFNKLAELQVEVYSSKQELVEYYHYLQTILAKKSKEHRKLFKEWYLYYSTKYDLKFPKEEYKKLFIDTEIEGLLEIKGELENHLKFIERTMGNVETIAFGIKHRIAIEELKRRL